LLVFKVTKAIPLVFLKLSPLAWQVAHPVVMPVWLIVQAVKLPVVIAAGDVV
jgi:predicted small integral membrane protein